MAAAQCVSSLVTLSVCSLTQSAHQLRVRAHSQETEDASCLRISEERDWVLFEPSKTGL